MHAKKAATCRTAFHVTDIPTVWVVLLLTVLTLGASTSAGDLDDLARPQEGRSMRAAIEPGNGARIPFCTSRRRAFPPVDTFAARQQNGLRPKTCGNNTQR